MFLFGTEIDYVNEVLVHSFKSTIQTPRVLVVVEKAFNLIWTG